MKNNSKIALVLIIVAAMVSVAAITIHSDNSVAAGGMYYAMDNSQISIDGDLAIDYNLDVDINAAPGDYSCPIMITSNGNYTGTLSIGILDKSTTPWTYTTYASLLLTGASNVQIVASIETGPIIVAGFEVSNMSTNAQLATDGTYELRDGVPSGTFEVTQGMVQLGISNGTTDVPFNGTLTAGGFSMASEYVYGATVAIADDGTVQLSGYAYAPVMSAPNPVPPAGVTFNYPTPKLSFSGSASIQYPDALQQLLDSWGDNVTDVLTTVGVEVTIEDGAVITAGDRVPSLATDVSIEGTNIARGVLFDVANPDAWNSNDNGNTQVNGTGTVVTFYNVPLGTYTLFMYANTDYVYLSAVTVTATGITLGSNILPSTIMANDAFYSVEPDDLSYHAGAYTFMFALNMDTLETGTATVNNSTSTGTLTFPEYGYNDNHMLAVMRNQATGLQEVFFGAIGYNWVGGLLKATTTVTLTTPDLIRGGDVSTYSAISTFTVAGADTVHIFGTLNLLYTSADQYGAFDIMNGAFVNLDADGGKIIQGVMPPANGSLAESPVYLIFGSNNLVTAYYFTNDTTGIPAATYTLTSLKNAIKESNQVTLCGYFVILEDLTLSSPNSDPLKVIIGPNATLQVGRVQVDDDNPAISSILTIPDGTTLINPSGRNYSVVNGQAVYDAKPSTYDSPTVDVITTGNNRFIYTDLATALDISTGNVTIDALRWATLIRNATVQSGVTLNDIFGITIPEDMMLIVNETFDSKADMIIDGTLMINNIVNFGKDSTIALDGSIVVASNGALNLNGSNLVGDANSVLVVDGTLNMTAASTVNVNTVFIEGKATITDLTVDGILRIGAVPSLSTGYTNSADITGKLTLGDTAVAWVYGDFNGKSAFTNANVISTQYMIDATPYLTIYVDSSNTTQYLPMIYGDEFGADGYMLDISIKDWNNNSMLRGDSLIANIGAAYVGDTNWKIVYADWSAIQFRVSFYYMPGVLWSCNGQTIDSYNNSVMVDYGASISVQAFVQPGYQGTPVIQKDGTAVSGNPYTTTITGSVTFSIRDGSVLVTTAVSTVSFTAEIAEGYPGETIPILFSVSWNTGFVLGSLGVDVGPTLSYSSANELGFFATQGSSSCIFSPTTQRLTAEMGTDNFTNTTYTGEAFVVWATITDSGSVMITVYNQSGFYDQTVTSLQNVIVNGYMLKDTVASEKSSGVPASKAFVYQGVYETPSAVAGHLLSSVSLEPGYQWVSPDSKFVLGTNDYAVLNTETGKTFMLSVTAEQPVMYTVTFDSNGGTAVPPQTVEQGFTATEPTEPIKQYYRLVEWQYNGVVYDFSTPVTGNITLVAYWELAYNLTISPAANISGYQYSFNGTDWSDYTSQVSINGDEVWIKAIVNDGCYFVNWQSGVTDNPAHITGITSNLSYTPTAVQVITYSYNTSNHTATVTSIYAGYSGQLSIPETTVYASESYSVVAIAAGAAGSNPYLTSVSIPASVVQIGGSAFSGCTGLKIVSFAYGTTVNASAFPASAVEIIYTGADNLSAQLSGSTVGMDIEEAAGKVIRRVSVGTSYGGFEIPSAGSGTNWSFAMGAGSVYYVKAYQVAGVLVGDVNSDGRVDAGDVLMLRMYLADMPVDIDLDMADVNGDHNVDAGDVLVLRMYLADMDVSGIMRTL